MAAQSNLQLLAAYEGELLGLRASYAMAALVVYEHLSTFKYEIDFLFQRRWSASTWIFIFNRYLLLATAVFISVPYKQQVCDNSRAINALFFFTASELTAVPSLVFSVLRASSIILHHSWRPIATWALAVLACAIFTLDTYVDFTFIWVYVSDPVLGSTCVQTTPSAAVGLVQRMAATILIILLNIFVLAVTVAKTAHQVRQASLLGFETTVSEILLRDGSIFFLITLITNIIISIPTFTAGAKSNGVATYVLGPIFDTLPYILLSHFIINLRQVHSPTASLSTSQYASRFSIPNFRMPTLDEVVGNLGQPLEFAEYQVDEEYSARDGGEEVDAMSEVEQQDAEAMVGVVHSWEDLEAASSSGTEHDSRGAGHRHSG